MRSKTGYAEFSYFHCYLKMDAPRALVFRPLVKGNEALGTRLKLRRKDAQCTLGMRNSTGSPLFADFKSDLSRVVRSRPLAKGTKTLGTRVVWTEPQITEPWINYFCQI